jgi:hypothetical protein
MAGWLAPKKAARWALPKAASWEKRWAECSGGSSAALRGKRWAETWVSQMAELSGYTTAALRARKRVEQSASCWAAYSVERWGLTTVDL